MDVIKLNEVYKPKKDYKVIVKTITFNQSKYIQDTLNGIAMQKTNFPFVNIVLEDNSTDREQEVIRFWLERECNMYLAEYFDIPTADIIIVPHKTNQNCTFAIYFHKENLYQQKEKREAQVNPWRINSEYEAYCEGDDYWIDPYKLQKQVDILENNSNIGLCYTSAKVYNQRKRNFTNILSLDYKNFESLLTFNPITTLTVLFRKSLLDSFHINIKPETKGWLMGDYPLWLWIGSQSDIYFIKDITAVYRHLENSASHHTNPQKQEQFNASIRDVRLYFQKLILPNKDMEDIFNDDFYRRNALFGITHNNRNYCFSNIKHVKNKNWKDKLKQILCFNKLSFSILRFIILKKI